MPVIEYILLGLICFGLGVSTGNKKETVRQPDKQIIIDDSTKVVNI